MNISDALNNVAERLFGIKSTQQDISTLSKTAKYAQSPEFQQTVQQIKSEVQAYAAAQLLLQAISTGAIVIVAITAVRTFAGNNKRRRAA